ncbi:autotransporter outer membrane beta-barrel domain-containing protein [Xenorhabdus sp. 12]|uniref:Autotransporter outer membrane beta-barrel domain-containing protein n=1 Tax=Xenorhabdus santafensis TaxID=2582833 RepID=A0ABU4S863_9GAMM|nr:autotransporter domain-containing protein [Xenorhabdus sp. 12]MDX7986983.1 autotransporter outer membrane beta-barrel domain-containing protein [Xenorhabdus sp. 12]
MKKQDRIPQSSLAAAGLSVKTQPRILCYAIACCLAAASAGAYAENNNLKNYVETGRLGNPASWRTQEFQNEWGLGAIRADEAYARGYTGKGIKLGILDQYVYVKHPELMGKGKVTNLITEGIREYTDPYLKVNKGTKFKYGDGPKLEGDGKVGAHGVHVAGIAAANRDGKEMHGVAYDAQIIGADNGDPGPEDGKILGNDGGVYQAGWDALRNSGVRIINNSWGIGVPKKLEDGGSDPNAAHFTLVEAQKQFDEIKPILGTKPGGAYQGAIDAARSGIVTIFAAGNSKNFTEPDAIAGLAWFVPDIAPNWLTVASLQQDPNSANSEPYTISSFSSRCGYTASFCVSAPGSQIYSSMIKGQLDDIKNGYAKWSGTSMAAPHAAGSIAVLMERFPYMTGAQVASVLRTTATDMGEKGIDELYGWGLINLGKAINGPGMFYTAEDIPEKFRIPDPDGVAYGNGQFIADIPGVGAILDKGQPTERVCEGDQCESDIWSNDISGHGGLTKQGRGALSLSGANTYSGPTLVKQGLLNVNGSISSTVLVMENGALGGAGSVGEVTVQRGGIVAPGDAIGTLKVADKMIFEPGSHYAVEISGDGRGDNIQVEKNAQLNGATVSVSLENTGNLLSHNKVSGFLKHPYRILNARQGISGYFEQPTSTNSLFVDTTLSYQPSEVNLHVERNDTAFVDVAKTQNERELAAAADSLGFGNSVYESILTSHSAEQARNVYCQLDGQIHADVASLLVNNSRYLRDTLNSRLSQAEGRSLSSDIHGDNNGAWVRLLSAWEHASGTENASGYQANNYGVLLGIDTLIDDYSRLGVATGYTRTSLDGGNRSTADSNNYHLALYGDRQFGDFALRTNGGFTWHQIDTKRLISYGNQYDDENANYDGRTAQISAELAYHLPVGAANLEPFANLAYVNFQSEGINEKGAAAALHGDRQHTEATLSTLGLRANHNWQMPSGALVALNGELGWQHQYGDRERATGLSFRGSNTTFLTRSVPISRDGVVLKANAEVKANDNVSVTFGYSGVLSKNHQDNSINAGFIWRF